jgi:hypothetical protein
MFCTRTWRFRDLGVLFVLRPLGLFRVGVIFAVEDYRVDVFITAVFVRLDLIAERRR